MRIRRKWIRDLAGVVFTVYYLIAAEQADEKVRKVRGMLTVDHLRVSWNKGTTPYLGFLSNLLRPRFMRYPPRAIRIPRPSSSDYKEPVNGWLYFDGPLSALKKHTKIVLDIPGGGFVAMDPRTNDDKLFAWAGKTGLAVLSLDYKKAPEYPYPYALNECYDVYSTIIASRGRCVGFSGESIPKVVITGDSAGGNLAASTTLMIIESGSTDTRTYLGQEALPIPDGLVLIYPGLDMNIGNWMSDEQMSLIKDRKYRKTNKGVIQRKSMQYTLAAGTPHQSEDEDESPMKLPSPPLDKEDGIEVSPQTPSAISLPSPQYSSAAPSLLSPPLTRTSANIQPTPSTSHRPAPLRTRLAMSSMISYFNDRILTPEMMRAMIILYIGPHNRPDFSTDYLLSPILAPDSLLAQFPKTYFITGERDPLVDDTVIFAGRLRRCQRDGIAEVMLIPGISHGFLQFVGIFPEGWKYIFQCGKWIQEIFYDSEQRESAKAYGTERHHRRTRTESSGDEDMGLEMRMSVSGRGKGLGHVNGNGHENGEVRRRKEKLLREEIGRGSGSGERGRTRLRGGIKRQKSMVSLASEDDLLGRRMLGLVGGLTGRGDDGNADD